ncbi:MAG: hypothetical protein IJQ50_04675, partial [Clostridia bacterium]|nr:hypothetical protein [Clostridia bacterium]
MKKVITLITVFSMLVCLAVPVQAVNTVLVDEDFSSYEGGNTLSGWTVEADASRLTAVEDDYGTAIKVTTSASSNIIKRVFEAQTSGQILLTADVKVNTSANPVVYLSNADGSQRTSVSVKNPNKVGEWTKVNFLLDITANTIERWFDEDYTSASTSDFKVTSCSVLFFANWAPVDNGGYIIIDNVKVTVLPQEFSVSSSGAHSSAYDVFNVGTEKSYTFNYKNTDNANKNISVEITAKNNAGSTIKTHTYAKEVKAGARYSEKFVFECANQTVGNVSVRLTVDGDVANYLNYKFICANTKARIAKATPASGVNTHMGQGRAAANTVLMSKPTGVATVRDGIEWWRCETTKGTIKVPNDLDPMINTAYENGTEILFLLSYGNTLYSSSEKDIPTTTEYKNAWLNYVEYIVTRYKDKVDYWQVWNEPNISTFNANNATVAQYTELLRITYNKIKSIDPTSKVIGGGLAGSGNTDTIPYLQSMLSNGAGNY